MATLEQASDLAATFRGAGYQTVLSIIPGGWKILIGRLPTHNVDAVILSSRGSVTFAGFAPMLFDNLANTTYRDIVTAYAEAASELAAA